MTARWGALVLVLAGCRERRPAEANPPPEPPPTSLSSAAPSATTSSPVRGRRRGTDVTFLVVSDTHVGYRYPDDLERVSKSAVTAPVGIDREELALIAEVNAIAGRRYPAAIGGTVATPRGLVITGDLTEWGRTHEWARFVELFGLRGTEGPLKLPVFEMIGNHDTNDNGPWVGDQVAARHGGRFYSWDWDDLHLVALGEAPDDAGFAFLERDLERVAPDVPLVLFFHRALAGPWSTNNWFDDAKKARLARTIEGRNVVAVFHGHHHATAHYVWRGLDVWKPGAVKHGAHTFAVVHATDRQWAVATYDWDARRWAGSFVKPLTR